MPPWNFAGPKVNLPVARDGDRSGQSPAGADRHRWWNGNAQAAKRATSTIPIIFTVGGDPVKSGLVASSNRPGGNLTGMSQLVNALVGKRLSIVARVRPLGRLDRHACQSEKPDRVRRRRRRPRRGAQARPANPCRECEQHKRNRQPLSTTLRTAASRRIVLSPTIHFHRNRRSQIMSLTAQPRPTRDLLTRASIAEMGGLMSYSASATNALPPGRPVWSPGSSRARSRPICRSQQPTKV